MFINYFSTFYIQNHEKLHTLNEMFPSTIATELIKYVDYTYDSHVHAVVETLSYGLREGGCGAQLPAATDLTAMTVAQVRAYFKNAIDGQDAAVIPCAVQADILFQKKGFE